MRNKLKQEIAKYVNNNQNIYFHWKGRVSLYSLLKSMDIKPGDEVILPAFTCVVVPNAILYLGAKPVYVDIDIDTFNINMDQLVKSISVKTKVIICQNTFGLSSNLEEVIDLAKKNNIFTIEDCTHGFGGIYNNNPNGLNCDAAFFSTQWNKPFSTGLGGFALVNNIKLIDKMNTLEKIKISPSLKDVLVLRLLYILRRYLIRPKTYWFMIKLYRWLSKKNLILGSSSGKEISSIEIPNNFVKDFSNTQVREGLKNIKRLPLLLSSRKRNSEIYTIFLKSIGKNHVLSSLFENHAFLKYPILVKDRDKFLGLAEKEEISLGDWFISPIHPIKENFQLWGFNESDFPNATYVAQKIVNLPTDTDKPDNVIKFLTRYQHYIEDIRQ